MFTGRGWQDNNAWRVGDSEGGNGTIRVNNFNPTILVMISNNYTPYDVVSVCETHMFDRCRWLTGTDAGKFPPFSYRSGPAITSCIFIQRSQPNTGRNDSSNILGTLEALHTPQRAKTYTSCNSHYLERFNM